MRSSGHTTAVAPWASSRLYVQNARLSSDRAWSTSKPGAPFAASAIRSSLVKRRFTTLRNMASTCPGDSCVLGFSASIVASQIELSCEPTCHHWVRRSQAQKKMWPIPESGKRVRCPAAPIVGRLTAKDVETHFERHPVQQQCVAELCSSSPARPVSSAVSRQAGHLAGAGGIEPPNGGIKIPCLTAWLRPNGPGIPSQIPTGNDGL